MPDAGMRVLPRRVATHVTLVVALLLLVLGSLALHLFKSNLLETSEPELQPQTQAAYSRLAAPRRSRESRQADAQAEDEQLSAREPVPRAIVLQPFERLRWQLLGALPLICLAVWLLVWWMAQRLFFRVDREMQQLQQNNATLITQRRQLVSQADRDCRFFQEASHDFRQRLHAMQLLLHTLQKSDPREGRQLVAKSLYVVLNLQSYVRDFLELARLKVDNQPVNCRPLEVQQLFQELELGYEDIALERHIDLRFRASALHLASDHKLLQRILENLLANACKFARSRVLVAARPCGSGIALEVWDNGPGIAEEDRQRIFDAYYQATRACPAADQGVGLGLAIVMRLCVVLGHAVSVHTRHGLTLVRVNIPGGDSSEKP